MKYIKIYADFLKKNLNPQRKLKVVFDCSNGTTELILKHLNTEKLKTTFINNIPDGNFPAHGPDPLKKNAMNDLRLAIRRHKADLGIIFDADGDRVFFADNKGRFINPDAIARLLIWNLKPKKIIIDIRTGWLVKNLKSQSAPSASASWRMGRRRTNLKIIESKVGHYFIKKLMRKIDADFSAEYSGHYYFSARGGSAFGGKKFYFDSGIMAAIEVINAISKLPYSTANFMDLLPQYYRSPELNFKVKNTKNILKKIEKYFKSQTKSYKLKAISYLDGLTMEFNPPANRWWFNLRPSNTEPLLRLNVEAENKKLLDKKIKILHSLISTFK